MSVESFFHINQSDQSFRDRLEGWRGGEASPKSPIRLIADLIDKEAKNGISQHVNAWVSAYNRQDLPRVRHAESHFLFNSHALVFSISLMALEDSIWQQRFYPREFVQRMRAGMGRLAPFNVPRKWGKLEPYDLTHGEWEQMVAAASDDKTLSIFFRNIGLMPYPLRVLFEKNKSGRKLIETKILPRYSALAESILGPQGKLLYVDEVLRMFGTSEEPESSGIVIIPSSQKKSVDY